MSESTRRDVADAAATFKPHSAEPWAAFKPRTAVPDVRTALVFLDANVLLAPYRTSKEALDAIRETYSRLRSEGRLFVPAQAAREFARNRPALLGQLHRLLTDARSYSMSGQFDAPQILRGLEEFAEVKASLEQINEGLKRYRSGMSKLHEVVTRWQADDPVLRVYSELFSDSQVVECGLPDDELERVRKARYERQMPPGFRDKTKDDGGGGDLAIWLTVVSVCATRKADAILVTEDSKDDWFHRSPDRRLFPRYELVEEFSARVPGRTMALWSLSELLAAHGAPPPLVEQVASGEIASRALDLVPLAPGARFVVSRVSDLFGHAVRVFRRDPAEVRIRRGSRRIAIRIVPLESARGSVSAQTGLPIREAQELARQSKFDESVVAFVAANNSQASTLENWLAEDSFQGPKVAVIVLEDCDGAFICRLNQSSIPELRTAFPVQR